VTISTRLIGLIMTTCVLVGSAAAQELPLPGLDDPLSPSELTLPADDGLDDYTMEESGEQSMLVGEPPIDVDGLEGVDPGESCENYAGPQNMWDDYSAPIESTGTWFRRGFWYANAEAIVWNRFWNRDSKFMAAQDSNVTNPQFFPSAPNAFGQKPVWSTNRLLMLDGSQPGEDTSVRFTLGHFLFRDSRNRDHTVDFTAMGGGNWHQHRTLASESNFGLFTPFYISGNNRSYNLSTFQEVDYSSTFSDFELNYHVKPRMRRDRLVMDANGQWHRAANPGFTRDYLVGLRIMELKDILNWRAEDIQVLGDDGSYFIRTDNDLFGLQMGGGLTYEAARWSLGAGTKMGFYVNDAKGRATLDFTADDDDDADLYFAGDEMSWLVEVNVTGRYHLTPNYSIKAAYEMMYLTSIALAPYQATFITELSYLNTSGDPLYHGMSFGFEAYW
jgi:hypothetical protein